MSALLIGSGTGLPEAPAAEAAAVAECTATDPPPQVLDITATDLVFGAGQRSQIISVTLRSACGGDYGYVPNCAFPQACIAVGGVTARRTAAATSPAARLCTRDLTLFSQIAGSAARPTSEPDVFVAEIRNDYWTLNDKGDGFWPILTNACAGAWDATAAVTNSWRDPSTASAPFTATRAFSVRRKSHLSTHAGPEPVRSGAVVTVRGRLVRADWTYFDLPPSPTPTSRSSCSAGRRRGPTAPCGPSRPTVPAD